MNGMKTSKTKLKRGGCHIAGVLSVATRISEEHELFQGTPHAEGPLHHGAGATSLCGLLLPPPRFPPSMPAPGLAWFSYLAAPVDADSR